MITQHTCISCFKPTNCFYVVEGSSKYYMHILTHQLGIPAEEALTMASNEAVLDGAAIQAVTGRVDGSVLRKVYTCVMCAARKGLTPPVNEVDLELIAEDGSGSPMRASVFTEDPAKSVFNTGPEVLKARSEDEMRAKGSDKEIADYLESLEKRGYEWHVNGSGHNTITRTLENGNTRTVTTISSTPKNTKRAILNTEAKVRSFERMNHLDTKPRQQKMPSEDYARLMTQPPAPNAPDEDKPTVRPPLTAGLGTENLEKLSRLRPIEEPRRNFRSLDEKHDIIARYDKLSLDDQRDLLRREKIDTGYIHRWRKELKAARYTPPVNEPVQGEVIRMVEESQVQKSLVHKQVVDAALRRTADIVHPATPVHPAQTRPAVSPTPEQVAASSIHGKPLDTTNPIALLERKKYITRRLEVIDSEKAELVRKLQEQMDRVTAELDKEKILLAEELTKVQDAWLAMIT